MVTTFPTFIFAFKMETEFYQLFKLNVYALDRSNIILFCRNLN